MAQCRDAEPGPRPRHIRRVSPEWGVADWCCILRLFVGNHSSVCCMLGPGGVMTANCVTAGRLDHDDDGEAEVDSHPDSSHPRLRGGHQHRPGAMTAAGSSVCCLCHIS